ncbi:MAG: heme biosynthesis protein HemY [Alphaproteobacteria bacterium]|nr:heme biosynthesis protein HemY [Alphaproteobacteria bacterium]
MIRALWFLVKASVVVAIAVWLADQEGSIVIDWAPYKLTFHVGVFLLALFVLLFLSNLIFSVIKGILDMPKSFQRYRDITNREKGYRALTIGLTAIAAGDSKSASYQAHRARAFLKVEDGLVKLLEAQSARLNGEEEKAGQIFASLLEDKNAAFLGVRGLLQNAMDSGDYAGALELGRKGLAMYPKQTWLLKIVYHLEIRNRDWEAARKTLYRIEKTGEFPVNKANSDRVAMYIAEAEDARARGDEKTHYRALNKAYKCDKRFVPSVMRLGRMYLARGNKAAAASMIEDAWKLTPHPGLVPLWEEAMPRGKQGDTAVRVNWYERLMALNPDHVEGMLAMASVLIQEGLWGEAKKYLKKIDLLQPSVRLYKLWARLEEKSTGNDEAVKIWLEKASDAPREKVWICSETGHVYDDWKPVTDHGYFNTIVWDYPQSRHHDTALRLVSKVSSEPLLEAPARTGT